jgi:MoaA/NifB/PqqE/SkfB family radical SAM enzyme
MFTPSDLALLAGPLAANLATVFTDRVHPRAPAFVTWVLTERCPMRCAHCDMGKPGQEMGQGQRAALADMLGASAVRGVSLIGGEPTVLDDLAELAARLKSAGKWVSVSTSGHRVTRFLDAFRRDAVDAVVFSVDSHERAKHDAFRGKPGLFAEVESAIERLRGGPRVQVRCTINRRNFREIGAFVEHWQSRCDNLVFQIVQNNWRHSVREDDVLFRSSDRPELERVLQELAHKYPRHFGARHERYMARYTFEPEALHRDVGFRCLLTPAATCAIEPSGDVRLCHGRTDCAVGNVLRDDIETIWQGLLTRQTQKRMQAKDFGCMCWEAGYSENLVVLRVRRAVDAVTGT